MDIGSELRRARQARHLSLDDIAHGTKISHSVLRALESNAFHDVPGGLFTRGYLRAYAASVGLEADRLVEAYRAEFDPPPAAVSEPDRPTTNSGHPDPHWTVEETDASSRHSEILQFAVVLIVAVVYLVSLRHPQPAASLQAADAATTETAAAVAPIVAQPVGTTGSASALRAPLGLEIRASAPCWVDVTADGTHVFGRLLNAGDHQTLSVQNDVTMRVGDPAAFGFSIDGVTGRSLGDAGRAVTVRIDRSNYRTLLAARPVG